MLIFAVLFSDAEAYSTVVDGLVSLYGGVVDRSGVYDFDFTDYYASEMGEGLKREILVFSGDVGKEELVEVKERITSLEEDFAVDGKRRVNIDPGVINRGVWFASYKEKGFKEDVDGTWLHQVLGRKGEVFWHTFPEFKDERVRQFLMKLL